MFLSAPFALKEFSKVAPNGAVFVMETLDRKIETYNPFNQKLLNCKQICIQDHHKLTMFKLLTIVIFNAKPSIRIVVGDISETHIDSH